MTFCRFGLALPTETVLGVRLYRWGRASCIELVANLWVLARSINR